jgi:hypothetical protein
MAGRIPEDGPARLSMRHCAPNPLIPARTRALSRYTDDITRHQAFADLASLTVLCS